MPRPTRHRSPKRLTQSTLHGFVVSSSPPPAPIRPSAGQSSRPTRGRKRARSRTVQRGSSESSGAGAILFEPHVVELSETEEASPRRPLKRLMRQATTDSEGTGALTLSDSDEDESFDVQRSRGMRRLKRKSVALDSESEEDSPPKKHSKLVRGVRPPSPEEDLLDEVEEERIIEPRLRTRDKKSVYQKNLEKLKRKKRGEAVESDSATGEDEYDQDVPFKGAKPTDDVASDDDQDEEAENDDSFIVQDDNAVVPNLPVAFSMNTFQDLVRHFKIICQMFVHLAVQPKEARQEAMALLLKDDYFSVPLQITRRKLVSMRDSLVASSVWKPEFRKPIETFPDFECERMDYADPGCDACHLGGRLSTILGRLSGEPYDKRSFEPLGKTRQDSDDSEEEDSEEEEERFSDMRKEFHLGRFCAARTRVFHQFSHWEYALFKALLLEIDMLRDSTSGRGFVKVAFSKGKQPPTDLSDADGIMDWLDERNIIDNEWHKVKEMMDSAEKLEMKAKRGADDDDEL